MNKYVTIVLWLILVTSPIFANAATYYMCGTGATCGDGWNNGSDSNNGQAKTAPWLTLEHSFSGMSGGDTLVIGDGVYTGTANVIGNGAGTPPTGSAGAYTIVKAENDGEVHITAVGTSGSNVYLYYAPTITNVYWQFEGLLWSGATGTNVLLDYLRYVKLLRCGAYDSGTGNAVNFNVANCEYVLLEGCYAYGQGRYKFLTGSSVGDGYNIFRNCVGRMDLENASGEPMAVFAPYSAQNTLFQGCIAIDNNVASYYTNVGQYGGCFGVFDTGLATDNVSFKNSVCLNSQIAAGFIAANTPATNILFDNVIFWDIKPQSDLGIDSFYSRAVSATFTHCTLGDVVDSYNHHFLSSDTSATCVYNSIFTDIALSVGYRNVINPTYDYNAFYGNTYNQTLSDNDIAVDPIWSLSNTTGGLKYLPQIESGSNLSGLGQSGTDIGANLAYLWGTPGTLYGESGYNTVTATLMWPFPNEDLIKTKMTAYSSGGVSGARGFCTGTSISGGSQTLTKYIWEYLGNEIPCDVYGTCDTTPPTTAISQSSPQAIAGDSLTASGTCEDDVACTGTKCRIASEPDATHGTACTGTASWTCAGLSGFSEGANTLYCESYDAAGNYDSGNSITVNYTLPTASDKASVSQVTGGARMEQVTGGMTIQ